MDADEIRSQVKAECAVTHAANLLSQLAEFRRREEEVDRAHRAELAALRAELARAQEPKEPKEQKEQKEQKQTFFLAMDGYGQTFSLHDTQKKAMKRADNYDGFAVLKVEVGGKDKYVDVDDDDSWADSPADDDEEEEEEVPPARGSTFSGANVFHGKPGGVKRALSLARPEGASESAAAGGGAAKKAKTKK
jgi:hypothetical protein